jgi:ribulose-5-phosphate 4-epimerase/fuculose-1-phosphate aldolase
VASTARLIASAGLVEAFGHVSARLPEGGYVITGTGPLGAATAEQVFICDTDEQSSGRRAGMPLEACMHAAVYGHRKDVDAIVRVHSPSVVVVGLEGALPGVTHGLAGLAGDLAWTADPQLVTDGERARRAAEALGSADCLIIRGNGALVTAENLGDAAVRAWFLEERARVWVASGGRHELSPKELETRAGHWPAEAERARAWMQWRFGEGAA